MCEEKYALESQPASPTWELIQAIGINTMITLFFTYIKPKIGGEAVTTMFQDILETFIESDSTSKLDEYSLDKNNKKTEEKKEENKEENVMNSVTNAINKGDFSNIIAKGAEYLPGLLNMFNGQNQNTTKTNTQQKPSKKMAKW